MYDPVLSWRQKLVIIITSRLKTFTTGRSHPHKIQCGTTDNCHNHHAWVLRWMLLPILVATQIEGLPLVSFYNIRLRKWMGLFLDQKHHGSKKKVVFLMISKLYAIIVLLMDEGIQNWQWTQINSWNKNLFGKVWWKGWHQKIKPKMRIDLCPSMDYIRNSDEAYRLATYR